MNNIIKFLNFEDDNLVRSMLHLVQGKASTYRKGLSSV